MTIEFRRLSDNTKMISGFTFTKIVIVQSLEAEEAPTGQILSRYIEGINSDSHIVLPPVEFQTCFSALEFMHLVERLVLEATDQGEIPLLHVECHGDRIEGLEFENSSILAWADLAHALLPLNRATDFNLLAIFSACFGAYFIGKMGVIEPAPCYCLVAPTKEVDPGEIQAGFRVFYSNLLRHADIGSAVAAISRQRLTSGRWLATVAELWFETLIVGYIKAHCTKAAVRARAKRLYRRFLDEGHYQSIGALTRTLRRRNRTQLVNKYFDQYFMTLDIPQNRTRFDHSRSRVQNRLSNLRHTGIYVL